MENLTELEKHIKDLRNYVSRTDHKYVPIYKPGRVVHPIPFFGNIKTAEILTVGANPSNGEFINQRWPEEINNIDLMDRLMNYFNYSISSHKWFDKWEEALGHLERSYSDGIAAHIDLSPRAVISMEELLENKPKYNEMVTNDIEWFFKLLVLCDKVKLILIAGSIPKGPINKFLQDHSDENGFEWKFDCKPKKVRPYTTSHKLKFKDKTYRIFYCSSGPSYRIKPRIFIEKIRDNKDMLLKYLE
jgi:hypothetical protein